MCCYVQSHLPNNNDGNGTTVSTHCKYIVDDATEGSYGLVGLIIQLMDIHGGPKIHGVTSNLWMKVD
jgi:hypothetical protein